MKTKICIKSNGTNGKAIIAKLESLGGVNIKQYCGNDKDEYYYIGFDNTIVHTYRIPICYTEIFLPEENPFPKVMWVWSNEDFKAKRVVVGIYNKFQCSIICANTDSLEEYNKGNCGCNIYQYCEDIEEHQLSELEQAKKTIEELKQWLVDIADQLKDGGLNIHARGIEEKLKEL